MNNSAEILSKDHYKLFILFRDNIVFESKLIEYNIDYFVDLNQSGSLEQIRYFLLVKDIEVVDDILKENSIIGTIETLNIIDFEVAKKVYALFLKTILIVVLLFILLKIVESFLLTIV
jgi:hypothetical protein